MYPIYFYRIDYIINIISGGGAIKFQKDSLSVVIIINMLAKMIITRIKSETFFNGKNRKNEDDCIA